MCASRKFKPRNLSQKIIQAEKEQIRQHTCITTNKSAKAYMSMCVLECRLNNAKQEQHGEQCQANTGYVDPSWCPYGVKRMVERL